MASSFRQPHNPYASQESSQSNNNSSSSNDVYHALTRVLHHPSSEAIQQLDSIMSSTSQRWTLPLAERLTEAALREKTPERQDALMLLLTQVLPRWDEHLVYANVVTFHHHDNDDGGEGLVVAMLQWMDYGARHASGFVALAYLWQALDRVSGYTSWNPQRTDAPWWWYPKDEQRRFEEMAHVAVDILTERNNGCHAMDTSTGSEEDLRSSCAFFLCNLLKHDIKDWMFELDDLSHLVEELQRQAQPVDDHNENNASTVRLAFSCMALLSALEWKHYDSNINLNLMGNLVDYVSKVAFLTPAGGSPSGPRWTYEPVATLLRPSAQYLLSIWDLSQLEHTSERYWLPFVEATWTAILQGQNPASVTSLLFLLTSSMRLQVRRCLLSILAPSPSSQETSKLVEPCRGLVASLLNQCQQTDLSIATSSASLLRSLLNDRKEVATHDELSRSLWMAMDSFPVERLFDGILKLAAGDSISSKACQPLLLCMLDIVELLMSYPEGSRTSFRYGGTQRVESLIDFMSQFGSSKSRRDNVNRQDDMDQETPTTNNLSRLDESRLSFEGPLTEETVILKGLEGNIRIATATVLARMGYASSANDDSTLEQSALVVRSRIRSALHDFLTNVITVMPPTSQPSFTCIHRMLRLRSLLAYSCAEDENLIARTLAEYDQIYWKELHDRNQDLMKCEAKLEAALVDARALATDKQRCQRSMHSQVLANEHNMMRERKQATAEAAHLVEVHASERAKAEAMARELSKKLEQAETSRVEAESQVEASRAAEQKASGALQEALSNLEHTTQELAERTQQMDSLKTESARIAQQLTVAKEELSEASSRNESGQRELETTRQALSQSKQAYADLQDELEIVFANLSCLAQVYQFKEEEVSNIVENKDKAIQEARSNCETELRRNEELVKNQTQLELENERLTKRLARAKEKLESMRKSQLEQEERRKRHGPVSYINQLHNDRSGSRSVNTSRGQRRTLAGQENRMYFSSS